VQHLLHNSSLNTLVQIGAERGLYDNQREESGRDKTQVIVELLDISIILCGNPGGPCSKRGDAHPPVANVPQLLHASECARDALQLVVLLSRHH
jgi:hypothetical protein